MSTVTALEAKTRFGKLLARVARGEEIVITRHEKAVARLVPAGGATHAEVQNAVKSLQRLQSSIRKRTNSRSKLSDAEVRAAIETGRL